MKKPAYFTLPFLIAVLITAACSPSGNSKQSGNKKFFVQPVYLTISGIERDTSIKRKFEESFVQHKIKLITKDEMKLRLEAEGKRVGEKVFTKDAKLNSEEDIKRAMGREHRDVSNWLSVILELHEKDDSLMIFKSTWVNMPWPPDFSRIYVAKRKEINLTNLSYSIMENIYSIVDSILYSNELK